MVIYILYRELNWTENLDSKRISEQYRELVSVKIGLSDQTILLFDIFFCGILSRIIRTSCFFRITERRDDP